MYIKFAYFFLLIQFACLCSICWFQFFKSLNARGSCSKPFVIKSNSWQIAMFSLSICLKYFKIQVLGSKMPKVLSKDWDMNLNDKRTTFKSIQVLNSETQIAQNVCLYVWNIIVLLMFYVKHLECLKYMWLNFQLYLCSHLDYARNQSNF
jgi:hypothetical protein